LLLSYERNRANGIQGKSLGLLARRTVPDLREGPVLTPLGWLIDKESEMAGTSDILKGKWKQISGDVKQWWGDLTDDDITKVNGQRDKLVGIIQERYGRSKAEAEREVDEFLNKY
jgi:uncharacterized protein YjbJ (UPF0337 family)